MAAAWCRNGTVQLLARTKILDHRVHFLTTIILVFICSHCCNFYFILILCPAISSGSRFHNITQQDFRFRCKNITMASALCIKVNVEKIILLNRCSLMQTYFRNTCLLVMPFNSNIWHSTQERIIYVSIDNIYACTTQMYVSQTFWTRTINLGTDR